MQPNQSARNGLRRRIKDYLRDTFANCLEMPARAYCKDGLVFIRNFIKDYGKPSARAGQETQLKRSQAPHMTKALASPRKRRAGLVQGWQAKTRAGLVIVHQPPHKGVNHMKRNHISAPSVKRFFDGLKLTGLTLEDCKTIKAMCNGDKSSKVVGDQMGLSSVDTGPGLPGLKGWQYLDRCQRILTITNALINSRKGLAFGVETIRSTKDTMLDFNGLEYVNLGDTYDCTLVYDHAKARFYVTSWGDIVESALWQSIH